MKKQKDQIKVQVTLSTDCHKILQKTIEQANEGFTDGLVNMSHCVEFAIRHAKFDLEKIRRNSTHTSKLLQSICAEAKEDQAALREALLRLRAELRSKRPKAASKKGGSHGQT